MNLPTLNIEYLQMLFVRLVAVLLILPIHEFAHAFTANKLGDRTAYYQGRLTINPIKHLDIIGTLAIMFVGIGWAKPVPVDPRNFKNRKVGMAITAAAGPLSNLIMGYLSMLAYKLILLGYITQGWQGDWLEPLFMLCSTFIVINLSLAIFNLLPIPPLDGSKILLLALPGKAEYYFYRYGQVIRMALIFALFMGVLDVPIAFLRSGLLTAFDAMTAFVPVSIFY